MPEKKHCGRFGWLRYSTVLPTAPWALAANGKFLLDFGKNMGYGDKKMQLSTIALYMDNLETILKGLEENAASKKKLYRCIGIFAGILSVVLLV